MSSVRVRGEAYAVRKYGSNEVEKEEEKNPEKKEIKAKTDLAIFELKEQQRKVDAYIVRQEHLAKLQNRIDLAGLRKQNIKLQLLSKHAQRKVELEYQLQQNEVERDLAIARAEKDIDDEAQMAREEIALILEEQIKK